MQALAQKISTMDKLQPKKVIPPTPARPLARVVESLCLPCTLPGIMRQRVYTSIRCRLPQLDRIAFRVTEAGKAAIELAFKTNFDFNAAGEKFVLHVFKVTHREI